MAPWTTLDRTSCQLHGAQTKNGAPRAASSISLSHNMGNYLRRSKPIICSEGINYVSLKPQFSVHLLPWATRRKYDASFFFLVWRAREQHVNSRRLAVASGPRRR